MKIYSAATHIHDDDHKKSTEGRSEDNDLFEKEECCICRLSCVVGKNLVKVYKCVLKENIIYFYV